MVVRSEREELLSYINDAHKDAYGFRPTDFTRYTAMSIVQLRNEADYLSEAVVRELDRIEAQETESAARFERRVMETMAMGAKDRATALRWIFQADGHTDNVRMYGLSYVEFEYDLTHNYLS